MNSDKAPNILLLLLKNIFSNYAFLLVAKIIIVAFILLNLTRSNSLAANADNQGINRLRQCNADGIVISGFNGAFNPVFNNQQAKEYEFITSNPHCAAILSTYITAKVGLQGALAACGINKTVSPYPNLLTDALYFSQASRNTSKDSKCLAGFTAGLSVYTTSFLTAIGTQYEIAKDFYHNVSVCGSGWITSKPEGPNSRDITYSGYREMLHSKIMGHDALNCEDIIDNGDVGKYCREWIFNGMEYEDNPADGSDPCLDPTSTASTDKDDYAKQKYYLRGALQGTFNCDKYKNAIPYNEGVKVEHLEEAYNCCRKRSEGYMCLQYSKCDTSQEGCKDKKAVFCKANSKCEIKGGIEGGIKNAFVSGIFSVKLQYENILCAESYNFCPFNFSVGGGNDYCDLETDSIVENGERREMLETDFPEVSEFDPNSNPSDYNNMDQDVSSNCRSSEIRNPDCTLNQRAGKCRNYCQYMRHCTIIAGSSEKIVGNYSPYMSRACINFIGDSKNIYDYNGGFIAGSLKNFSAPIAQCVKETIENLFFNRVGHSKCDMSSEHPNQYEECENGYAKIEGLDNDDGFLIHQKGGKAKNKSFFEKIQNAMQQIVLLTLAVSIMIFGGKVLAGMVDLSKRKEIVVYVLKIAFIVYFAIGNAWQSKFFDGVYSTSSYISSLLFKMITPADEAKRDGCQFGSLILNEETQTIDFTAITNPYPKGKEYLAMWDTLDCKIAKYLGFGPTASVANIFSLILAGFITGPVGIYFSFAVMIFGIYLIVITVKSLHIFLGSALAIILMVFVSPIVFLMLLFDKTKEAFTKWFTALISFCLQPLFLAAYIFIVLTTMDKLLIGSATFELFDDDSKHIKTINCEAFCQHLSVENGRKVTKSEKSLYEQCINFRNDYAVIKDPMEDSVACLIDFDEFDTIPGLEIIGLPAIPIVMNLLSGDVTAKILSLLKAMLMIYLLNKFIGEIPGISSALTGSELNMLQMDGDSIFKKGVGVLAGMQKRASRGLMKGANKAGGAIAEKARKRSRTSAASAGGKHAASGPGGDGSSASSSGTTGNSSASNSSGNSGGSSASN